MKTVWEQSHGGSNPSSSAIAKGLKLKGFEPLIIFNSGEFYLQFWGIPFYKKQTQEMLAEEVGVGLRHIMAIGNEGSYPSYEVLYKLIRELHIPVDLIFYPEKQANDLQTNEQNKASFSFVLL